MYYLINVFVKIIIFSFYEYESATMKGKANNVVILQLFISHFVFLVLDPSDNMHTADNRPLCTHHARHFPAKARNKVVIE